MECCGVLPQERAEAEKYTLLFGALQLGERVALPETAAGAVLLRLCFGAGGRCCVVRRGGRPGRDGSRLGHLCGF